VYGRWLFCCQVDNDWIRSEKIMSGKVLAIYFSQPGALDYPLSKKNFFESYTTLINAIVDAGHVAVVVRADSYKQAGVFSPYFTYSRDSRQFTKVDDEICVDLVFNRDNENTIPRIEDVPVINHPDFDELCRDKVSAYEHFKQLSAVTLEVHSFEEARDALQHIDSQKIVLKPRFGEQGEGVTVCDRDDFSASFYDDWSNMLVQEFLDSSDGIEGLVEGLHEININMINGKFAGARIRQPAEGQLSLAADVAEGRKLWGLHFEQIPKQAWDVAVAVDRKLERFWPRVFRADIIRDAAGVYKIIELNSRPGIMHADREGPEFYRDFNGTLEEALIEELSK
jgi:glutathione synthase/RimK-type ligase-like ATP-grasp enzyme